MEFEFKIGWCPFCKQGWAEIVKDITHNDLCVMCSECFTVWNSPEDFANNKPNPGYELTARFDDPSIEEIILKKWDKYIDKG